MKSYNEALEHYNSINKPPRSKKWKSDVMPDNAKPLRRTGETHYAIHMTDEGAIYYRLYDTHIATFYPPQADGTERRAFKYASTQTTSAFMGEHHLHFDGVQMDDGTLARIPYISGGSWRDNSLLTADLVCNAEGQVIRSRSWHKDIYTMKSTGDDKQKRKDFKKRLESLITLASFNMASLVDNATLECAWGEPFGTAYNEPRELKDLKDYIRERGADLEDNQFIAYFMSGVQGAFNVYASKLVYNAGGWQYANYYWNGHQRRDDAERIKLEAEHKSQLEQLRLNTLANITSDGFIKSLTNMLLTSAGLKTGTSKVAWGQFMPTLPVRWIS